MQSIRVNLEVRFFGLANCDILEGHESSYDPLTIIPKRATRDSEASRNSVVEMPLSTPTGTSLKLRLALSKKVGILSRKVWMQLMKRRPGKE